MNTQTAGYLVLYGLLLILLGTAGYVTNPEKAKTALMTGGSFGLIAILLGALGARGVRWSRWAAVVTTTLLSVACVWRAGLGWLAVSKGESEKFIPAILISVMLGASVVVLAMLLKSRKSQASDTPLPKE